MKFLPRQWWKLTWTWLFKAQELPNSKGEGKVLRGHSIFAAVLALSLGVGALSLTLAVVSGFEQSLGRKMEGYLGTYLVNIGWQESPELKSFSKELNANYTRVESIWRGQALLVGKKGGRGVVFESRETLRGVDLFSQYRNTQDSEVLVSLGSSLADYLGVEEGGSFRVLLPGITRKGIKARLAFVKNLGVYEIDSRSMLIDQRSLRSFLERSDLASLQERPGDAYSLRVSLDSGLYDALSVDTLEKHRLELKTRATNFFTKVDPQVLTWKRQHRNRLTTIEHDKGILSVILSILVIVAAFNVAAALLVVYFERDREIILIRSMGMTPGQLKQWILIMGVFLGVFSAGFGLLGARLLAWGLQVSKLIEIPEEIYNLSTLPIYFRAVEQLGVFVFGVFSACFVAYVLGHKISKMNIVEVLGHRR